MHKFVIDRQKSLNIVDFYIDGVLAKRTYGAIQRDLDTVVIGSCGMGENNQLPVSPVSASFQSVEVNAFSPTFDYQSLATSGVIPDWMKLRETGTNSQIDDVTVIPDSELPGSSTNDGMGSWVLDKSGIYAQGPRGYLDYLIRAPTDDAYRIEIEGRERSYQVPLVELPLVFWLDGVYLGQYTLPYSPTNDGVVDCFTPFIRSGTHTLRVLWDSSAPRRSLYVQAVRLQSLFSTYTDAQGMKMWEARRMRAQSGVEYAPSSSLVSPVCIEGRDPYLAMMQLLAGTNNLLSSIAVMPGAGRRWYANVPLSPSTATQVEASFQNGGLKETNLITWQTTDLLQGGSVTIRQGDSLLFNAVPEGATNGTVDISVSGGASFTTDVNTPMPIQFNQSGTFTVTGTYGSSAATGSVNVTVVGVTLPPSVAGLGSRNYWDCTNLVPGVFLDCDPRLEVMQLSAADRSNIDPTLSPLPENGRTYRMRNTRAYESRYMLARLWQNGPILASTAVQGFHWFTPPNASFKVVDGLADGTQVIEGTYILSPVLTNVTVTFQIVTAGVTFDDGTISRTIGASDFDALGIFRARFLRGPNVLGSVCNVTELFDNGIMIATQ
jgi:hypothetical protein